MRRSILGPGFESIGAGSFSDEATEIDTPSDQLPLQFEDQKTKPSDGAERETVPLSEPEGTRMHDAPPIETASSINESFLDLPIRHLLDPQPIVYEKAPRGKPALEQYYRGAKKPKEFGDYNALRSIFTLENTRESREKLLHLQDALYETHLKGLTFPDMVDTYLSLLKIINKIGLDVQGGGRSELQNFFVSTFNHTFVAHHDVTEKELAFLESYINKTMVQGKEESYWRGMMQGVGISVSNYLFVRDYVRNRQSEQTERLRTLLEREQGELQSLGRELLEVIRIQRRFGLRSSFYQDDLFHDKDDGWVMMHPFEFEKKLPGTLATIFLASRNSVLMGGIGTKKVSLFQHEAMRAQAELATFDSKLAMSLALDGELYIGGTHGRIPVREIFRRQDQEPLYDLWLLSFIARVHDLVVPAGGVKRLPSHAKLRDCVKKMMSDKGTEDEFRTIIRSFIIQRVEYINDPDQVKKDEDSEHEKRVGVRVGVKPLAGTVYYLPEGHHRTAYAEANFLENEGYSIEELDTTGTLGYKKPYDMPLYTYTRVIPEQKSDADRE